MRGLFVVCILVLLLPILLWAQSSPGILSGTVLDSNRAVLPRATVRLISLAGVEIRRTLTDREGRFRFDNLAADSYTVELHGSAGLPSIEADLPRWDPSRFLRGTSHAHRFFATERD